jgi:hypothetical protein
MVKQEQFDKRFESLTEKELPGFFRRYKYNKFLSEKHVKLAAEKIQNKDILIKTMYHVFFKNGKSKSKLNI